MTPPLDAWPGVADDDVAAGRPRTPVLLPVPSTIYDRDGAMWLPYGAVWEAPAAREVALYRQLRLAGEEIRDGDPASLPGLKVLEKRGLERPIRSPVTMHPDEGARPFEPPAVWRRVEIGQGWVRWDGEIPETVSDAVRPRLPARRLLFRLFEAARPGPARRLFRWFARHEPNRALGILGAGGWTEEGRFRFGHTVFELAEEDLVGLLASEVSDHRTRALEHLGRLGAPARRRGRGR